MPYTLKQYALYNVPLSPSQDVPPEDVWLFNAPFKTFETSTPETFVFNTFNTLKSSTKPRLVGVNRIPSKVVLKARLVHFSDYTRVVVVDKLDEPEPETKPEPPAKPEPTPTTTKTRARKSKKVET